MCLHIYNLHIIACDVKQPISVSLKLYHFSMANMTTNKNIFTVSITIMSDRTVHSSRMTPLLSKCSKVFAYSQEVNWYYAGSYSNKVPGLAIWAIILCKLFCFILFSIFIDLSHNNCKKWSLITLYSIFQGLKSKLKK